MMTKGGQKSQKIDDVFYERPLTIFRELGLRQIFLFPPKFEKRKYQYLPEY